VSRPGDTHGIEVDAGRAGALAAVARVAEEWDAHWRPEGEGGGRLVMPRIAGLHRGILIGRLQVYPGEAGGGEGGGGEGSRVVYEIEAVQDHVHMAAVGILALAAFGALLTVLWPIFPSLLPVAPLGALLALGGWFLVVSRLHNSGAEEFLRLVRDAAAEPDPAVGPEPEPETDVTPITDQP
jgi:hypothetical protein